jgi:hypothetical protein
MSLFSPAPPRSRSRRVASWCGAAVTLTLVSVTVGAPAPVDAVSTAEQQSRPIWDTSPVVTHRHPIPPPKVVDLRWGEHASFDRVVIDLRGKVPGVDVRYVRVLRYDGSGQRVPLPGRRHLAIVLQPASAHDRSGHSVYQGPQLRRLNLPVLRGVALTGDFEGTVSFGLALSRRADFRVLFLHAPNRIVIDLRH